MVTQTICAWCKRLMSDEKSDSVIAGLVAHGMCMDCRSFLSTNVPTPLSKSIDRYEVPALVISSEGVILTANARAVSALGRGLPDMVGLLGGELMECSYARLPGGCGQTIHCGGCAIRQAVKDTYETGVPLERVTAYQDVLNAGRSERRRLVISTEKRDGLVILAFDELGEIEPVTFDS